LNVEYNTKKLAKSVGNLKLIGKNYGSRAKKVNQRLEDLKSSPDLEVFKIVCPSCHPLKGDRLGEFAVEISGNHRIIFRINQQPVPTDDKNQILFSKVTSITIMSIGEDYH